MTSTTSMSSRSRRALLAGALGGLAAWAASTAARVSPAEAAAGDPIRMGQLNRASGRGTELQTSSNKPAFWARQRGKGAAVRAEAGLLGAFCRSTEHGGIGVWGTNEDNGGTGVLGSASLGTGVSGGTVSGTGVKGVVHSEGGGFGVWGEVIGEPSDFLAAGVYGKGVKASWAGRFDGHVQISHDLQILPRAFDPAEFNVSGAKLLVRSNVAGKIELCVQFPSGPVQVLATQS